MNITRQEEDVEGGKQLSPLQRVLNLRVGEEMSFDIYARTM
jgi:hypothetical protein